jgi:hypothetical protein
MTLRNLVHTRSIEVKNNGGAIPLLLHMSLWPVKVFYFNDSIPVTNYALYFFLIRIVGGGVQTGSTRHVGHSLAYCTCPG